MARKVHALHVITGELTVQTELTVGSGRSGVDADIESIRDGLGRLVIPGESLAGALVRIKGVERWDGQGTGRERASQVWIEHAVVAAAPQGHQGGVQVFDHVNRDRRTGTAVPGGLHSAEVVRPGTKFTFEVLVEQPLGDDRRWVDTVVAIAAALKDGIHVGAKRSANQGLVTCAKPKITSFEVATPQGMLDRLAALGGQSPKAPRSLEQFCTDQGVKPPAMSRNELTIVIPWRAEAPVLSSRSEEGLATRVPVLVEGSEGLYGRLTVRQSFRVLAERIERTARGGTQRPLAGAKTEFDRQVLDERCALTHVLFGAMGGEGVGRAAAWAQGLAYTATAVASQKKWGPVETAQAWRATEAVKKMRAHVALRRAVDGCPGLVLREHNRIEPWSGAPLDGHLFSEIAIRRSVSWEPMIVTVDLDRLATTFDWSASDGAQEWVVGRSAEQAKAALGLLLLTLREACGSGLGAGGSVSRAMGWMAIDPAKVRFKCPEGGVAGFLAGRTLGDLGDEDLAEALGEVERAWQRAVQGGREDV